MTIAWVFPGQGSQKLGMADSLIELPGAKERFDFASEIIGRDLLKILSEQQQKDIPWSKDLNDTRNTQPAMFLVESLLVDDLRRQGREPALVAGHSLGEIVALYAADVLDVKTALNLLKSRSELMAAAGGGAMTAILGFNREELEELVTSIDGVVIANDNSSSQVVLSGSPEAVQSVTKILKCKRAIPLQVSGAFHSPFMEEASQAFAKELEKVSFNEATFPVLSNSDPMPTCDSQLLKEKLKRQMNTGVRWRETMDVMLEEGINTIVEIGPGNVLSGLAKRSLKGVTTSQIGTAIDLGH
tara:strand:- start:241 stop:1140 length:900 start_codon:yes stop_codon:yes gene_type:complete